MVRADNAARLKELSALLDSCRRAEAPVFSPTAWDAAQKNAARAHTLHEQKSTSPELDQKLQLAIDEAHKSLKNAGVVRSKLSSSIALRSKARAAGAPLQVPREYSHAEEVFVAAARKVEAGNVEGGQADAKKAEPLYDAAELAAIRQSVLKRADSLLAAAAQAKSDKYAPATLGQAQEYRMRAYNQILADRSDTAKAWTDAHEAEYQAQHAMALSRYIQEIQSKRSTPEQIVLGFENELARLAATAGLKPPPFNVGPVGAVDSLTRQLTSQGSDLSTAGSELSQVASILSKGLSESGETSPSGHPVELATQAAERLVRLTDEKADWARMAQARQAQLAEVSQVADETAFELSRRQERETKFKAAANMLSVSEGTVLYNDSDDIVLRLTGLTFDSGESDILPRHEKILAKVQTILESFPGSKIVVEGHTDSQGNPSSNLSLSHRRADNVSHWLAKNMKVEADVLTAKGWGDKHPVASNSTSDGRTKNRRIDVVILK